MFTEPRSYAFMPVTNCDMCGSTHFKLLGMRLSASQGRSPKKVSGVAVSVKRCLDCGLIFSDPQPVPPRLSDHYGVPPEEYWHEHALGVEAPTVTAAIEIAQQLLGSRSGMTALDVGAGVGQTMAALNRAGFDAYGIEPSESFWRRLDQERVKLATVEQAEFPSSRFDFITFGAVLEHLYSPSAALERALTWLRPGGIIHATVPNARHLIAKLLNIYFRLRGTNYVTHLSPMHVPFHLFEFSPESFRRNGKLLGYGIAESRFAVCDVTHIPKPMKPLFRHYMAATDTGMELAVWLRKL
jgi:SAM-dependent methyltransferase